jgi:hypothetical protein
LYLTWLVVIAAVEVEVPPALHDAADTKRTHFPDFALIPSLLDLSRLLCQ